MASETDILSALATYREHIGRVNHRAMSTLIPQIEAASMDDPDLFECPEEEEEMCVEYVLGLVGASKHSTRPPIERTSDLLKNWDVLAPQLALDGASVNADSEWRAANRKAYTSAILQGLGRFGCPTGTWALPRDFEILMRHVDSLEGPGWYMFRDIGEKLVFWEGWGQSEYGVRDESVKARCKSGQCIIEHTVEVDEDYDVAGGWACGEKGNESTCYAIYSRPKGGKSEVWSWRYVAFMGQFGTRIFEDIIAVLDWYHQRGQPTEEEFTVTAEEVFSP